MLMKTEWFSWFCKKLLSLWCQSNSICDSCIVVVVSFHQKLNFVEEKWHHQIDLLHRLLKQGLHSKLRTKLAYCTWNYMYHCCLNQLESMVKRFCFVIVVQCSYNNYIEYYCLSWGVVTWDLHHKVSTAYC